MEEESPGWRGPDQSLFWHQHLLYVEPLLPSPSPPEGGKASHDGLPTDMGPAEESRTLQKAHLP